MTKFLIIDYGDGVLLALGLSLDSSSSVSPCGVGCRVEIA